MNPSEKHHYNLIVGEIVFKEKDQENVGAIRVNGVLINADKEIPIRMLGKAQQILQLNFHQRMQDENIEVLDVVLTNFVYLGHMTQEEFQKTPEGTKLQEKPTAPSVDTVPDLDAVVAQHATETTETKPE